uniref:Secreted protein n=1 Tax=Macrostomum lignano TaxID=282301 RepID=A0A1I8HEC0_9PLAT
MLAAAPSRFATKSSSQLGATAPPRPTTKPPSRRAPSCRCRPRRSRISGRAGPVRRLANSGPRSWRASCSRRGVTKSTGWPLFRAWTSPVRRPS